MGKNNEVITLGNYLKDARISKNMTINDLAFAIDKNNIENYERKIKKWEANKDYPTLDDIYKLCYVLQINPGELLTLRNRGRKQFIKKSAEPKKKLFNWELLTDVSYESFRLICKAILLVGVCVFLIAFLKVIDIFFGSGDKITEPIIVRQIDNWVENENEISADDLLNNKENEISTDNLLNNKENEMFTDN